MMACNMASFKKESTPQSTRINFHQTKCSYVKVLKKPSSKKRTFFKLTHPEYSYNHPFNIHHIQLDVASGAAQNVLS